MSPANDVLALFERWQLDVRRVREQVYRAATPRERERWHALWLLSRGLSQAQVAEALDRDAHTVGLWVESFRDKGPSALAFEQMGGSPPLSTRRLRPS
jgi:transposase